MKQNANAAELSALTESELIARAADGDTAAFGVLMKKYETYVGSLVFSVVRNEEDAFDVSQETFLKAWHHLSAYKGESAFSTWLFRIAKNAAYDFLRARKRKVGTVSLTVTDEDGEDTVPDIPDENETTRPESVLISKERTKMLYDAMDELSDEHREILLLRDIQDRSYESIAAALCLEIGTVKSRLFRAREALRKKLIEKKYFRAEE